MRIVMAFFEIKTCPRRAHADELGPCDIDASLSNLISNLQVYICVGGIWEEYNILGTLNEWENGRVSRVEQCGRTRKKEGIFLKIPFSQAQNLKYCVNTQEYMLPSRKCFYKIVYNAKMLISSASSVGRARDF